MKKRWIGWLTVGVMAASMAMPVSAAEIVYSEECGDVEAGDSVIATYTDDGVLTLNGKGDMRNCRILLNPDGSVPFPWESSMAHAQEIEHVVVEDGVTGICGFSFAQNLKTVSLPNSLEIISWTGFMHCKNLESIVIPPKVTELYSGTFQNAPDDFTVYGYKNTYAEAYAAEFAYNFKAMGDMNGDGSVDLEDASDIIRTYAQHASGGDVSVYQAAAEESTAPDLADVNRDGAVEIADATLTMKYYAQTAAGLDADWTQLLTE